MAGWLDQLGNGFIGAGSGYLTGGLGGAVAGGLSSLINKKPLTLGSGIGQGLMGAGAGYLGGKVAGMLPSMGGAGAAAGTARAAAPASGGWSLGGMLGGLGNDVKGLIGGIGGLGSLGGILGRGGGGQQQPQQPQQSQQPAQNQRYAMGNPGGQVFQAPGGALGALGVAGGLGALGYGLSQGSPKVDLTAPFQGQQGQTTDTINAAAQQQQQQYQQAQQQLAASRAAGMTSLQNLLGPQTQTMMQNAIRGNEDQLAAQGLLNGPSGAMDQALAQSAARVTASQLPALENYQNQTQNLSDETSLGSLQNTLGLEQSGLQRNFGLTDQLTNASLKQQLLNASQQNTQNSALMGLGAMGLGYGLGGLNGAMVGQQMGGTLEGMLGQQNYNYLNAGMGGSSYPYGMTRGLYSGGMGGYGGMMY